jgi:hypothetical protein
VVKTTIYLPEDLLRELKRDSSVYPSGYLDELRAAWRD